MNTKNLTKAAAIAALYVVLTYVSSAFGLASGAIQLRLSEALTILPMLMPGAVVGLTVGCLVSNITTGCVMTDVIMGTFATFLGALGTKKLGKKNKFLGVLSPILSNTLIVPFVIKFAYGAEEILPFLFLTVGIGEILSCGVLGLILYKLLSKFNLD